MGDLPTPTNIMQVGLGFWASKTLLSAVEMEVFTELAKHPEDLETLQGRLGLHLRSAHDFLDALVALGFLQKIDGLYHNTPETDLYLDRQKSSYVGGALEMANHRLFSSWNHLTEALRTGESQNEAKTFAALYADPARLKEFLRAMTAISRPGNLAIAQQFPWNGHKTFLDVGTAQGDLAVQVAQTHSHLSGIGFDLAEVEPIFEDHALHNGLSQRLRFEAGDFFKDSLPKADVIMMGHILHDWDLEQKKMLMGKAFKALPNGGPFIVYESVIDDDRSQNAFGLLMSLNMLIETPGGFDFTGADCQGWMKEIGFRETRVEHLVAPAWMIFGIM